MYVYINLINGSRGSIKHNLITYFSIIYTQGNNTRNLEIKFFINAIMNLRNKMFNADM